MSSGSLLGELCEAIVDCPHRTAPVAEPGEEFGFVIGTPNIRNGRLIFEGAKRVNRSTYETWTARAVPEEDDLILAREAPVGQVGRVGKGERVCLGQRTVLIRPDRSKVSPRFLHYLLQSPGCQEWMLTRASGSTVAHLNVSDIRNLSVGCLPDRWSQDRIAAVLASVDEKMTLNERVGNAAVGLAEAEFGAFLETGRVNALVHLRDAARWFSGGTPRTSEPGFWGGDIPWISAASLRSPWVSHSDRCLTAVGADSGTRLVPARAILFVVRGMSLKKEFRVGIAQREVAFGQDCKALVAKGDVDPYWLFYAIRTKTAEILAMVDEAGHGTGRLVTDRLANLEIPLPGDGAANLLSVLKMLSERAARCAQENRALAELRDTLLPRLISGELRIREITDFGVRWLDARAKR